MDSQRMNSVDDILRKTGFINVPRTMLTDLPQDITDLLVNLVSGRTDAVKDSAFHELQHQMRNVLPDAEGECVFTLILYAAGGHITD